MIDLFGKHVILGFSNHIFLKLYIDVLVNKCSLRSENICIVSIDENKPAHSEVDNVTVYHFNDIPLESFSDCKTITAISLNKANAKFIAEILGGEKNSTKFYLHLTDDEVDRWLRTYRDEGSLIPTKTNNYDDDCFFVLNNTYNIIAPKPYFSDSLRLLFPEKKFSFIDARDPFKSMPTALWDRFSTLCEEGGEYTKPEKKVLIGAKRGVFNLSNIIMIIRELYKAGAFPETKLLLFTYKKKKIIRVMIDFYLGYLRHVKKCNVDIGYPTATNAISYNSLVMSCSHLILQGRGSMSTARSYVSVGMGNVLIKYGTPNFHELTEAEELKVFGYKNFQELAAMVVSNKDNSNVNQDIIMRRFEEKYEKLKRIYD